MEYFSYLCIHKLIFQSHMNRLLQWLSYIPSWRKISVDLFAWIFTLLILLACIRVRYGKTLAVERRARSSTSFGDPQILASCRRDAWMHFAYAWGAGGGYSQCHRVARAGRSGCAHDALSSEQRPCVLARRHHARLRQARSVLRCGRHHRHI